MLDAAQTAHGAVMYPVPAPLDAQGIDHATFDRIQGSFLCAFRHKTILCHRYQGGRVNPCFSKPSLQIRKGNDRIEQFWVTVPPPRFFWPRRDR